MRSASWPIAARIALSGAIGTFGSVTAIFCHLDRWIGCFMDSVACRPRPELPVLDFPAIVLQTLSLTVIAVTFVSPLIAMAIAAGMAFERSIERHLFLWSLASPAVVWLFVCIITTSMQNNIHSATHTFPERLRVSVMGADNLIFLFGPMVSGLAFYGLSASRRGHPSSRDTRSDRSPR